MGTMEPWESPWGEIDNIYEIGDGVEAYSVSTPSHGGVMVPDVYANWFSDDCLDIADKYSGYWCWEEDCAESVVIYELARQGMFDFPEDNYSCTYEEYMEAVKNTIERWYPEYYEEHVA